MPTPLPTLAGVYYATVHGASKGFPVSNILAFKKDGMVVNDVDDPANALHVATIIGTHWVTAIGQVSAAYASSRSAVYPLGSPSLPAYESFFISGGGISSGSTVQSACFVVSHHVLRRGKGTQGLTRLGPISDFICQDGLMAFNPGAVAAAQSDWTAFISAVLVDLGTASPGTWTYVQVSKKGTGASYPVINSTVQPYVGSARERIGRV